MEDAHEQDAGEESDFTDEEEDREVCTTTSA